MPDPDSKAALITGASRGIGAATAIEMASQGVAVVLAARSVEDSQAVVKRIRDDGGTAEFLACDVARYADVVAAVDLCREKFGRLDYLINNAGVIEPIGALADSDPQQWTHAVDINLKGIYHGLRAALPVMHAQKHGVIVNVSSGAANQALEGWSQYCCAKAGAAMLTQAAHLENADKGVRVVGLSPGTVATQMQVLIKQSGINPVSQLDPSVHIDPGWPARAIAWLCTEDAKEFDGTDVSLRDESIRKRIGLI